eukprot:m.180442 g.180442  ORF g.180442 m.180442 type:complete len:76 (-) comp18418_c0_seq4:652-879(-)
MRLAIEWVPSNLMRTCTIGVVEFTTGSPHFEALSGIQNELVLKRRKKNALVRDVIRDRRFNGYLQKVPSTSGAPQ